MKITEHFDSSEFVCHHCGASGIRKDFVERLEQLRQQIGKPIIVTSGYRCPMHPIERGKKRPGYHAQGIASDITVPGMKARDLYEIAYASNLFTGFGLDEKNNYVHLDARPGPIARWRYKDEKVTPWGETAA